MDYTPIAIQTAHENGLDPALVQAICHVESGWDTYAMRYEPQFEARYLTGLDFRRVSPCSRDTERKGRAMSWGLMQVMGQVARELGFDGPYLSALCDPALGLRYGCLHLRRKMDKYGSQGIEAVISAYNAGQPVRRPDGTWANGIYVRMVLEQLQKYKET